MKKKHKIAVVGMACIYPDADNYMQLWENVLAKRRAFRQVPDCRLSSAYFNPDHPDAVYMNIAAVIKNYDFDRAKYHISGSSFRTADVAHWMALETADKALTDSGLNVSDLPLQDTGVFVGNTLTGEMTRSNQLRLRWPYIAKSIAKEFRDMGWAEGDIENFLRSYEQNFKAPFSQMEEDSLAGGLSNTIAGRICNYFDLKGGGYTVDGACSSSLLSIIEACQSIENNSLKVAIAGGVDISLDPFELVGFSRTGALAKKEMSVYDKNANGFWPGEGCGFVVLMDYEEAVNRSLNIYSVINGWGISSDGQGGITRPTIEGQLLAMEKAYDRAGYDIDQVAYVEGHGTGTKVGDQVELETILTRLNNAEANEKTFVGSVKSNIGHAKAAAGIAGFIKAVMAVKNQLIPPVAGLKNENELLENTDSLKVSQSARLWDVNRPLKASISAMGFGGINTHITIENPTVHRRSQLTEKETQLISSYQDAEVYLFDASTKDELIDQLKQIHQLSGKMSFSEMADLSCKLSEQLSNGNLKAAIVAGRPVELEQKLSLAIEHLTSADDDLNDLKQKIFISHGTTKKIGLMFPGQGIDMQIQGDLFKARFPEFSAEIDRVHHLRDSQKEIDTAIIQPMSAAISLCGLDLLDKMNVHASRAVGHSFGEIPALYWGGIIDRETLIDLSNRRGALINEFAERNGAMLSVQTDLKSVFKLIENSSLKVGVVNSENHFVLSGKRSEIEQINLEAKKQNIPSTLLNVDHAFHSQLMESVSTPFSDYLKNLNFEAPSAKVISSVTANKITSKTNVQQLLVDQLTCPVKFHNAIMMAEKDIDVWIDMGSKAGLKAIVSRFSDKPVLTMGTFANSMADFLSVAAFSFAFCSGSSLRFLFENRFRRDLDLGAGDTFITNPCESVDLPELDDNLVLTAEKKNEETTHETDWKNANGNLPTLFRQMLADRLELPVESISEESRMLDDLHLNSITVSEIVTSTAKLMGCMLPSSPTEYANASVSEICAALSVLAENGGAEILEEKHVAGIDKWVETFKLKYIPEDLLNEAAGDNKVIIVDSPGLNIDEELYSKEPTLLISLLGFNKNNLLEQLVSAFNRIRESGIDKVLIIQDKPLVNGFAKSYHLENPSVGFKILTLAQAGIDIIRKEVQSIGRFEEIYYDKNVRKKAYLEATQIEKSPVYLEKGDVVLITGGGKGITAECGLALARTYDVRLAIMGRSDPTKDAKLSNNLERFKKHGVDYIYLSVDVTDRDAVEETLLATSKHFGQITAIIHGAGVNEPCPFSQLTTEKIKATLAPKYSGLRNILNPIDKDELKYVFTFGSIIAESGMAGNADYALANQWMANYLRDFQNSHPDVICHNMQWSVWSGAGMGEKLNVLESLVNSGIEPITIDQGVNKFLEVIQCANDHSNLIISGRIGELKTINFAKSDNPLLRFAEDIKVLYPGIELISDCEITYQNDPYLADHEIDNVGVFPTVMGLEAVEQLTRLLSGSKVISKISNLKLNSAITIDKDSGEKLRFIVQRSGSTSYKAVIRKASNGFIDDCFSMNIEVCEKLPESNDTIEVVESRDLVSSEDIYGNLLFHKGRFRRIHTYRIADAYECFADLKDAEVNSWYGNYLPQVVCGNDPAARDAVLHAVQVCVPYKTLLPVDIGEITRFGAIIDHMHVYAKEKSHDNDSYLYDIHLINGEGNVVEKWSDVRFRSLKNNRNGIRFNTHLSRNYIRRILDDHSKRSTSFSFMNGVMSNYEVMKRPDGKPELKDHLFLSKSKSGDYSISVESNNPVGCDIQKVAEEEKSWADLIGNNRYEIAMSISQSSSISLEEACYRIWGIIESLKKAGMPLDSPFTLAEADGRSLLFNSGEADILSIILPMKKGEYVLTILEMDRIRVPGTKSIIDEKIL